MIRKTLITLFLFLVTVVVLLQFVKGGSIKDPFYYQTHNDTAFGGPFEQSISAGRYALTEAIGSSKTFLLSVGLAKFSSPDVVFYHNKFFSVFTPGIAILGVPLYLLGLYFGYPQLFTYLTILLTSLINIFLIILLVKRIGGSYYAGFFAALIFLFATNALAYTFTFTQHTTTVMLVLLALLNASASKRTFLNNLLFGALLGISPIIDIPNIFLVAPIAIYVLAKHFAVDEQNRKLFLKVKLNIFILLLGLIPFIGFFGWYNLQTAGSPLKIAQLIGNTKIFVQKSLYKPNTTLPDKNKPPTIGINLPFKTRSELNGFYTLLLSDERSWLFYSPVVFIGLLGLLSALKGKNKTMAILSSSVILTNIVIYSMFSDPWGGWAFGPRYLIPAASLLCVYMAIAIDHYKSNIIFAGLLLLLTIYSVWVNVMGALTTISIPPKVEAVALLKPVPYTWHYSQQLISKNFSSSLLYNLTLHNYLSVKSFVLSLTGAILFLLLILYLLSLFAKEKKSY